MRNITAGLGALLMLAATAVFGQARVGIIGALEWDTMEINAAVSLDMASAHIRLPGGRSQGEALITAEYPGLILPGLLKLQVDSSSTVADLVRRGEWSLQETERVALRARSVPPSLSPDLHNLRASYTIGLEWISARLIRHNLAAEPPRILSPIAAPVYTGIIIIANEALPVWGMKSTALPTPCLFPKVWDSEMNLIYERNMLDPGKSFMVRYAPVQSIFQENPSGLSAEVIAITGDRPLRIFARGIFGTQPTDPIIDRVDALQILSSEENRRLLREGRVVIVIDDSMLHGEL
ncbi:MAG: polymerase [Treponema sp.]|jgi:hypothetical protein|nr:polymerase [Treponema sp.]